MGCEVAARRAAAVGVHVALAVMGGLLGRPAWLSAMARHPLLWRMIGTVRAATATRSTVRFVVGEFRGGTRRHRTWLGPTVLLRHRTRDIELVNEIFGHLHAYDPPDELREQLNAPLRILDLGGNIGMFGAFALGAWRVESIHSFEPDPDNARLLTATIAANAAQVRWTLIQAAASNREGRIQFLNGQLAQSRQTLDDETGIAVDAVDVFAHTRRADLMKLDIEGGEWAILTDPRMRDLPVQIILLEWHWLRSPNPNPHDAVCQLLDLAGYEVILDRPDPHTNATGVLWARRPR